MKFKHISAIVIIAIIAITFVGCTVPQAVTHPDGTSTTNQVVDPKLDQGIIVARATNAATAPINPFAALIDWGLATVAAGALLVAKAKNDKASKSSLLLKTVVQTIDALDQQPIKDAVQSHAANIGVEGDLNRFVKQVSSGAI